ncbi:MAG: HAD hydrolase family protein [Planctomycetota bacterium]
MKLRILALDYDGTIAVDGRLDPEVRSAIGDARASGLAVVLVTGRILDDLRCLIGNLRIFDAVVAENGAVLSFPLSGRSSLLAPPVPEAYVRALRDRGVVVHVGSCLVDLDANDAHVALDILQRMELPLVCHFNRGRLMVLPQAVSKATGLRAALQIMRLSTHNAAAVGDGENDHELLRVCEVGAAVAWGSPALRAAADMIVDGDGPAAVAAYVRASSAQNRIVLPQKARRNLLLGRDERGGVVSLAVRGRNVLVAGDPRSGKSWVAGLLCEQLLAEHYSLCVIDPEGDYQELEALPGVVTFGGDDPLPSVHQLRRTLRHADVSVILDLARLDAAAKRAYVDTALTTVTQLRRETGLPHRIVVDEAHYFLGDERQVRVLDPELAGYTLITYRVSGLHDDVLARTECIIVTRETDPTEARLLHARFDGREDVAHWLRVLAGLGMDEAVLLPHGEEAGGQLRRFHIAPRLTRHVRHRHKYLDLCVGASVAFQFASSSRGRHQAVRSLQEMIDVLAASPNEDLAGYARRGDLSKWVEHVIADATLADEVRDLEEGFRLGTIPDFGGAVAHAILQRYQIDEEPT